MTTAADCPEYTNCNCGFPIFAFPLQELLESLKLLYVSVVDSLINELYDVVLQQVIVSCAFEAHRNASIGLSFLFDDINESPSLSPRSVRAEESAAIVRFASFSSSLLRTLSTTVTIGYKGISGIREHFSWYLNRFFTHFQSVIREYRV
jgi:hypothetical protein